MPSRIFADEDILSLIHTFEASNPWLPKNESPPLISNTTNTHLIPATHLITRLAQVLSDSNHKTALPLSQLAEILDIDESNLQIVIRASQHDIHFTTKGEILPDAVLQQITSRLCALVDTQIVDLSDYARENDLDITVLKKLVREDLSKWRHLPADKHDELYCRVEASRKLQTILSSHIVEAAASATKADVSAIPEFEGYSVDVIMAVVKDGGDDLAKGNCRVEGGGVVFVPSGFAQAEEKRLREVLNSRVKEVLDVVTEDGYCAINKDDVALQNAIFGSRADGDVMLLSGSKSDAKIAKGSSAVKRRDHVVLRRALEASLESLKAAIDDKAEAKWATGERKLDYSEIIREISREPAGQQSQLEPILLDSGSHSSELEAHLRSKTIALDTADQETYLKLLIDRLLIPIHLYTSGLEIVQDETLRARLSAYSSSHLLSEIPSLADDLKAQHLLTGPRERDFTKFRSTATELKDLPALQSAAIKLAKKAKWDAQPLPAPQIRQVKVNILQRTAHAMRPSSAVRPSDVLQHALWILLGVASEGVFISAGKDTSRMIALYESVAGGDAAMVEKLKGLRDKLKKGEAADDEVREMREVVKGSVDRFVKGT